MEQDFKQLVLTNAREIFLKYGYAKTTMNDIAKACHKSKGLIYHHFESKEEIFKIIVSNEVNSIIDKTLHEVNQLKTAPEKLKKYIIALINYTTNTTNIFNKLLFEIAEYYTHVHDIIENFKTRSNSIVENIIIQGNNENDFEVTDIPETVKSINAIIAGYIKPSFSILEIRIFERPKIDVLITMILHGIMKK